MRDRHNYLTGYTADMSALLSVFLFVLGTIVGSFLNVLLLRGGTGLDVRGRSFCPSCGLRIKVYDLVPIFSFLLLGGRCRSCGSRISVQYPLVEATLGLLFLGAYVLERALVPLLIDLVVATLLLYIAVYDIRHRIIPEPGVWIFNAVALTRLLLGATPLHVPAEVWWAFSAGPLMALPLWLLNVLSRGRWMGFGDVKLALGLGWLLGLSGVFPALAFAFWIGALAGVGLMALTPLARLLGRGAHLTMKSEVPFAPFLIIATLLTIAFNVTSTDLIFFLDFSWLFGSPHAP